MAFLFMIVRKMVANRWLAASLLLGMVIAVSLVSSIPAFTSGMLQQLLVKDLEAYQEQSKQYPGGLELTLHFNKAKPENLALAEAYGRKAQQGHLDGLDFPTISQVDMLQTIPLTSQLIRNQKRQEGGTHTSVTLASFRDINKHLELIDGRLPEPQSKEGVYEALVTEAALKKRNLVLGNEFVLTTPEKKEIHVRIVGVFNEKSGNDPYWFTNVSTFVSSFFLPYPSLKDGILAEHPILSTVKYYWAFDYHQIDVGQKGKLAGLEQVMKQDALSMGMDKSEFGFRFPVSGVITQYDAKRAQYELVLWSLYVPIFVMLGLYLVMVVRLIIDRQRTEIAVLASRGGSPRQIFAIYLWEIVLLGSVAYLIGPFLGVQLSRMLGVSNGFLEFVDRSGLRVTVSGDIFLYALWTILACFVILLIPVALATRQNIISHKLALARAQGQPVWHRFYLDVFLLLVAGYGWYSYQRAISPEQAADGVAAHTGSVDALLFFVPVLFVLGTGLLCLRLYPLLLTCIFWLGKRIWPPAVYTTLVQVGRSTRQYQFMMMFIVMTVAVGLYSASMARTLNQNMEELLRYRNGTDIRMKVDWRDNQPVRLIVRGPNAGGQGEDVVQPEKQTVVKYEEPPFASFTKLPGVAHATRVFVKDMGVVQHAADQVEHVKIMGIDPKEFGETVWFKSGLMPHHLNDYLNLLASEPSSVLISRSLADKLAMKPGDSIRLSWKGGRTGDFTVYGIVDYWPSWNPHPSKDDYGNVTESYLVIANLPQIQDKMWLEPYEVWLKLAPQASTHSLYQAITAQNMPVTQLLNVNQELIQTKTSAFYLGMNGSLTLGFLLSMLVTFTGYLIYWILTLGARKLQYGVFRAMGLSFGELVWMLAIEQVLTFGIAFLLGIGIGKLCNTLFLPALAIYVNAQAQVPPFVITSRASDELLIYGFIAVTLFIGLGILAMLLSRLQIHQAVKLGED